MRFTVLGLFEMAEGETDWTPSAPKVRQVLAVLVLRAGQVVSIDTLIEELWSDDPPRSATTTTQTYIYQLRRVFGRLQERSGLPDPLITRPPGYVLDIPPSEVDATRFNSMLDTGRALLAHDAREAARILREALALWRGPMLGNVNCGPLLRGYAAHFEERYVSALELRIAADMRLGRHHELIAELKSLVTRYPYNEWLHGQLIIALTRVGRRAEALEAYQDVRRLLDRDLGLEPSPDLKQVHAGLLHARSELSMDLESPLRAAI
ncbi:AfsR/SARP family transcriptional regulator [Actinomadura harenae]|uniref:Transcriptional regulator n=1 Tax=Actinomadura harenae TaxID=2483351 RepID=A0A3M2M0C1_9ACTN|nr:AfsR/SARP family transcriptional regulator [Actinomadura harenae]RMI43159.1 transcriptional regulator [Actinomadura harenae]